jgi:hypothetical protein
VKTVFISVSGKAEPGDDIRLYYTTSRGGRTDVCHVAKLNSDPVSIARDLADQINIGWFDTVFRATSRGSTVILTVGNEGSDYIFRADYPVRNGTIELGIDDTSA